MFFWGILKKRVSMRLSTQEPKMKEQLESNLITKFAAGLMERDEEKIMQEWLQQNPQFVSTVALIQQQVEAMNQEPILVSTHP